MRVLGIPRIPRQQFLCLAEVPARHRSRTGRVLYLRLGLQPIAGALQIISSQLHALRKFSLRIWLVTPFALWQSFLLAQPIAIRHRLKPTRADQRAIGGACPSLNITDA